MKKIICKLDLIAIALLYRKEFVGTDMISLNKIEKYQNIINNNLIKFATKYEIRMHKEEQEQLYFIMQDENENIYAVINPTVDLKKVWEHLIGSMPIEIYMASLFDNALKEIGLIVVNEKIINRNLYYNELRKKHNLCTEFQTKKFDIFRDWESVSEEGFTAHYCMSEEEKYIFKELIENKKLNEQREQEQLTILKRIKKQ